jgi:hypothetical protein
MSHKTLNKSNQAQFSFLSNGFYTDGKFLDMQSKEKKIDVTKGLYFSTDFYVTLMKLY